MQSLSSGATDACGNQGASAAAAASDAAVDRAGVSGALPCLPAWPLPERPGVRAASTGAESDPTEDPASESSEALSGIAADHRPSMPEGFHVGGQMGQRSMWASSAAGCSRLVSWTDLAPDCDVAATATVPRRPLALMTSGCSTHDDMWASSSKSWAFGAANSGPALRPSPGSRREAAHAPSAPSDTAEVLHRGAGMGTSRARALTENSTTTTPAKPAVAPAPASADWTSGAWRGKSTPSARASSRSSSSGGLVPCGGKAALPSGHKATMSLRKDTLASSGHGRASVSPLVRARGTLGEREPPRSPAPRPPR
mmetsp:Transcript_3495/g.14447  ORF Transcript_3495/g.14447 Transcript_3495/m.14447 type:complete len:312 (+) Transcript_3495:5486-6421(+)